MLQITEIGTISERIIQLVNHFCQGNKTAFGRAADIQSGVLAGIVGSRESKPGFEILQKLLTAYPSINPEWLLFGRGPMIQKEVESTPVEQETQSIVQEQFNLLTANARADQESLTKVYGIVEHPYRTSLALRLGVSEEEARTLVLEGRIRAKYTGADNDRAKLNGVSYMITERAVREFFDEE